MDTFMSYLYVLATLKVHYLVYYYMHWVYSRRCKMIRV